MSDTLASVLSEPDWTALPRTTPLRPKTASALPREGSHTRLADIADARLEIDDVLSAPHVDARCPVSISRTRERLMWASSLMLVGLIGGRVDGLGRPLGAALSRRLARS